MSFANARTVCVPMGLRFSWYGCNHVARPEVLHRGKYPKISDVYEAASGIFFAGALARVARTADTGKGLSDDVAQRKLSVEPRGTAVCFVLRWPPSCLPQAHALDYRRSAGGFIHGFRYSACAVGVQTRWR